MTAYTRGRQFEYRCRDHFKRLGYLVVRSPQSRSPFDLIVIGAHIVLLVQCKVGGSLSPQPWNELLTLADSVNARAIVASRVKRKILLHEIVDWKDGLHKRQPWVQIAYGENVASVFGPDHTHRNSRIARDRSPAATA